MMVNGMCSLLILAFRFSSDYMNWEDAELNCVANCLACSQTINRSYAKITWTYKDSNLIHFDYWNKRASV